MNKNNNNSYKKSIDKSIRIKIYFDGIAQEDK